MRLSVLYLCAGLTYSENIIPRMTRWLVRRGPPQKAAPTTTSGDEWLFCGGSVGGGSQSAEGFGVGRAGDATFGEDGSDVFVGRDVEGGVSSVNVGRDADAFDLGDFVGGAFFDGNVVAGGNGKIEGGDGRGDIKGDVVFLGEDGDLVSADFVGGVTIGRDAIGSSDDGGDFSGFQEMADHIVRDERERDIAAMKFPRGEARAL